MNIPERYFEMIPGYLRGELDQKDLTEFSRFIDNDPEFREMVLSLKSAVDLGDKPEWRSVNAAARELLDLMLKDTSKHTDEKVIRGVMTYDSAMLPEPEGVRPAGLSTRRLKYTFGVMTVILSLYPVHLKAVEIIGRINGLRARSGLEVTLYSSRKSYTAQVNKYRIFRFENIPAQAYKMRLIADSALVGEAEIRA